MENSGESKRRKLDDSTYKNSGPPSSSTATDINSAMPVDDSSNCQNYNVKLHKSEKPVSSEKHCDEGENDNEENDLDEGANENEKIYYDEEENDIEENVWYEEENDNEEDYWDEEEDDNEENDLEDNPYEEFCRNIPPPTQYMEDPSSPFVGEDDEVDENFNSFLAELPGKKNDVAYLPLREDANEITVALSKEEILELKSSKPFKATPQQIDAYLHCRLKLFPNEIQQRINRCSAYMISLNIKDLNEWTNRAPLSILEKALENEMKEVDVNIIPLLYGEHWTLAIVCGLGQQRDAHIPGVPFRLPCVLHFNSLPSFGITEFHAYAITKAVAEKAHIDANNVEWYEIESPRQSNAQDCGFYVMRFVVEFVKNISSSPHSLPVHYLFDLLEYSPRYFEEEEGEDEEKSKSKLKKVAKKALQQLKGFIGSIQPNDRNWMYEFSEGRPCTIDILPYCIPEKIIKADGNEYKVKMLNWVRTPSVPSDYVMKHWKHIYDDYIASHPKDY